MELGNFTADGFALGSKIRTLRLLLATFVVGVAALCLSVSSASATSPGVNSGAAANVAYSSATLNGDVNPNGAETKVFFEYGTTVAYGSKTAEVSVGSGSSPIERSQAVSGLTPNVEYHFRIVASNASGTSSGADRTFFLGWKNQPTATPESIGIFKDVSCTAANECTAVGSGIAQRWDGSKWKAQAGGSGLGVSCVSSVACFAVEEGTARFWNGTEWKTQSTPTPAGTPLLRDISCVSATDCTAVGAYSNSGPPATTKTLAMHWDGTEWKLQTTPNPVANEAYLASVSCTSASFCMAVGYYYEGGPTWAPLSMRWNGTEWTIKAPEKPAGATMSWLFGVSCTAATECTAVGQKEVNAGTHENQTVAQRWNGTEWKLQTTPNPEGSTNRRFEAISCTAATACTAIGSYSNGTGVEPPFSLRWNGTVWTVEVMAMPAGAEKALPFAVSCIASRGCVAVGQYRNAAANVVPLAEGNWRSPPPTSTTNAASGVAETSASLNGTVNPNGSTTKAYFEYGTTTAYGTKTAELNLGLGSSPVEKSQALSGLSPNTTYHYRIVANNENPETGYGADMTLTTIGPPQVTTGTGAPDSTGEAATLNGVVDPNGQSTTYQFEYGTSSGSYTTTVPIPAESAGSEMSGEPVSYKITGLTKGTKYFFRVTATNASGKVNGAESSFTTPKAPGATTIAAIEIKNNRATLTGSATANGLETKYQFEYGTTVAYGSKAPIPAKAFGPVPESELASQPVTGLTSKTVYHYRLVAENAIGTTYGADKTFTTLPSVSLKAGGKLLGPAAPLKVLGLGVKLGFTTCSEVEFSGTVSGNPGALQAVSTAKAQGCTYLGNKFEYSIPTKGMTLEYGTDVTGLKGVASLSKFTLVGVWAFGTCEYEVQLSGPYTFKASLQPELTGEAKGVKAAGSCPPPGSVSGKFSVTSSGLSVEAEA